MDKILVVDDEPIKRVTITDFLSKNGYEVLSCENAIDGLEKFKQENPAIVITDLKMPQMDGIEFLKEIKKINMDTIVIVMTAYATIETAVETMRQGAYDYLTKPFELDELLLMIKRIEELQRLKFENIELKEKLFEKYECCNIVGKSKKMREIYDLIANIADTQSTVLIQGESGTGKELIANAIHYNSNRRNKRLIKVNCAVFNENLLESELFGHEKGAFTGAMNRRLGRFELAQGGTIFLDDIDDLPQPIQVKLLRVLQEREFERVGGTASIPLDIRVIAASKENLLEKIKKGDFRKDLFYRINVVNIDLPPLRERREDIPLLVDHFLNKFCTREKREVPKVEQEAMKYLISYYWPGNVRELENMAEQIVTLVRGKAITGELVGERLSQSDDLDSFIDITKISPNNRVFNEIMRKAEKELIAWALKESKGNKTIAAQILKMKRSTFCDKVCKYGLETDSANGNPESDNENSA